MKTTVEIEQSTADEVTQWVSGIRSYASPETTADWLEAVGMTPPNGGGELGEIPDSVEGFDKVISGAWDWAAGKLKVDTHTKGGIGCNGIVIYSFTPTGPDDGVAATASVAGYPAPNMGNVITLCISKTPGVLYEPSPAMSDGQNPTLNYCLGMPKNSWTLQLEADVTYYLNVAGRKECTADNPAGVASCVQDALGMFKPDGSACDFRLEANVPGY